MKYIFGLFIVAIATAFVWMQDKPQQRETSPESEIAIENPSIENPTLESRFRVPSGYERISVAENSFAQFLRGLPLKPKGSLVTFFDGSQLYNNNGGYVAVIDLPIGSKNLHQCADAVIRLRADYLRQVGKQDAIHFNFTNGMRVDYKKWQEGFRIQVNEARTKTKWVKTTEPNDSYDSYWDYLEQIFMFAGTASLEKELKPRAWKEMQIGDVLILGGHPGHAVIIVDMAEHKETGAKLFMVAQSFMPAQDLHIINSPEVTSPWYSADLPLNITSWSFTKDNLKYF